MLIKIIPLFVLCARLCHATTTYDRYTAQPATEEQIAHFTYAGLKSTCTIDIADCDPTERRRVDGSCNNLDNPVRGTYFEPVYRVLEGVYYNGSYPRKNVDGSDMKSARSIRTSLLMEGKALNLEFTQALPAYGIFTFGDIGSIHDILQFIRNKTDCCTAEGKKSRGCSPIDVPVDDPVHRFSGIRCLNLTTPLVFSDYGCTNDTKPSPVERATGTFDLSLIYNAGGLGDSVIRNYTKGLLTTEVDTNGIIWPPNGNGFCVANQPGETRCFARYSTVLLSGMLLSIWYMRLHNHFATQLAAVNPHWDDNQLFYTARDMVISFHVQLYYYEWAPAVVGHENMVNAGVISDDPGFRDVYNETMFPQVSLEFTYLLRWFHTMQDGAGNMYDTDGNFLKAFPLVNGTFRPGFLGVDNNIAKITPHMYRQACAKVDYAVDSDFAENGLAYIQHSVDIPASDLYKSRLLGFPPYVDYVEYCTGHTITCFDDLSQHMEKERIELLKTVYDDVRDIDLLAGTWSENIIEGGSIPATLACVITEFLNKAVRYDRHWYERADRPYAHTKAQLAEMRKASLALLICTSGDDVKEIQPQAFRVISEDNPLTPCSELPQIDFSAWCDETTTDSTTTQTTTTDSTSTDSTSTDSTSTESTSTDSTSTDSTSTDSTSTDSTSTDSTSTDSTSTDSTSTDSTSTDSTSTDSTSTDSTSTDSTTTESTGSDYGGYSNW